MSEVKEIHLAASRCLAQPLPYVGILHCYIGTPNAANRVSAGMERLYTMKKQRGINYPAFFISLREIWDELATLGEPQSESMKNMKLLNGVKHDPRYKDTVIKLFEFPNCDISFVNDKLMLVATPSMMYPSKGNAQ